MKFSEQWLREWVNPAVSTAELGERLTMAGLEVEAVEPAAGPVSGVVVGEVLEVGSHPDADKLSLCRVTDGREEYQVVCGAPNVVAGMRVPYARVGAKLSNGVKIRRAKIRGVESLGMLCSAEELAMAESSEGLLPLPADTALGGDIIEVLGLDDQSIELGLTPNRGDCLGIAGLAREVAALHDISIDHPAIEAVAAQSEQAVPVRLEAPEACPRYACRVISGVDVNAESPLWLQERLRRCDLRSIDPVVDVTNYILLELGQPLHAFDLDKLDTGIVVRMAKDGEKLKLLDDSEVTLNSDDLVIADHDKAIALAGIMGGANTAVGEGTRSILLESAFFAPLALAGKARTQGMHTDASHRFERGVDFRLQEQAIERATALLLEIAGGTPGPLVIEEDESTLPARDTITLRAERLQRLLGVDVPADTVSAILERLGMKVSSSNGAWQVTPPSWRFDLSIEADLIEEVARVYGYERIPVQRQHSAIGMRARPEARLRLSDARRRLVSLGYQEVVTYSFVDPQLQSLVDPDCEPVALRNPISADMTVMRTTLWPGLLQAMQHNLKRQQPRVRLFECGLHFRVEAGELRQRQALAGLAVGDRTPENWTTDATPVDFFDLKGDVETLLVELCGSDEFGFGAGAHPALHPGQTAAVYRAGEVVGVLGRLHPSLQKELGISQQVYLFELDYAEITPRNLPKFKGLSKFPEVRRDLAVVVDMNLPAGELVMDVKEAAGDLLQNIMLFDMYAGQHIDSDKKSLAFGMVLQHPERTLTDEEINSLVDKVVNTLSERHGAVLRN